MDSILLRYSPNSTLVHQNGAVSFSTGRTTACTTTTLPFKSTFFCNKTLSREKTRFRPGPVHFSAANSTSASCHTFDVVIIGAGIIGLTIARQFLFGSDLSVAVVDKALPCSGATGAGQGYIWMIHKTPGSEKWDLAMRSHKLWKKFAESVRDQCLDPLQVLGWKKTGSLLIGRNPEELVLLQEMVKQLCEAGLRAEYLPGSDLLQKEPELMIGEHSGAAFLPDDCQLDARHTAAYIEKVNRDFASKGRYAEFFHDPVKCLLRSHSSGEVEAVQTSKNTLYCKKAVVVAAGCWSGSLMHDLFRETDIVLDVPVKPRKGHLLVLENFNPLKLNHGTMEVGYTYHHNLTMHPGRQENGQMLSISMGATTDMTGNLVLGSSRQFAGFDTEVDESIIDGIWLRAAEFFPKLRDFSLTDLRSRKVRIGLRPYMPDGKPVIGPVPSLSNVFLATGHEGEGLSLALGTAEMVADMVLQNPLKVDGAPFAVQGRCC
ncbi:hypothetical protein Patl1_03122 [Pistacia atlantica]|uniref:Uncharacterized protein n=1 Tax=Pistacia atlantica TaxID=434234 RepID=A0ACC1C5Q8_9ROSI|nr:hypothetical protein Patl1_03122 [Pistacia atlantica]